MRAIGIRTFIFVALVAVVLTGCSKSKSSSSATTTTPKPTVSTTTLPTDTSDSTIKVASNKLGNILVNNTGMTLYLDEKDTATTSMCVSSCAASWPPLTGALTAGTGLDATKITTITRDDGTKQLAYNGHPLYTWTGDSKAGDATGQDVSGFYVVSSAGKQIGD